mmetsp:Transcript_18925/g.46467  ORF Transcript_18925/g.46467 Transcript_18925/m.46467 type:complete len:100 (-) Transcript_18925:32-331(-)
MAESAPTAPRGAALPQDTRGNLAHVRVSRAAAALPRDTRAEVSHTCVCAGDLCGVRGITQVSHAVVCARHARRAARVCSRGVCVRSARTPSAGDSVFFL